MRSAQTIETLRAEKRSAASPSGSCRTMLPAISAASSADSPRSLDVVGEPVDRQQRKHGLLEGGRHEDGKEQRGREPEEAAE